MGNSSCPNALCGDIGIFLTSDFNWNTISSWVSSLSIFKLEFKLLFLLVLRSSDSNYNYIISSPGSPICQLQILYFSVSTVVWTNYHKFICINLYAQIHIHTHLLILFPWLILINTPLFKKPILYNFLL